MRLLLAALLAANVLYWSWWQGWLPFVGLPAPRAESGQREPARLAAQVRPEAVEVVDARQAARLATLKCLQAGPFRDSAWPAVETAAGRIGLAPGEWQRVPVEAPATGALLRVPEADPAQQARLLASGELELGTSFGACP